MPTFGGVVETKVVSVSGVSVFAFDAGDDRLLKTEVYLGAMVHSRFQQKR